MIEEYIKLGEYNKLEIYKQVEFGLYLKSQEENDEVLLPIKYVTKDMKISDIIEVFVYSDSEDRYVATTQKPLAILNEFGYFEVVDTSKFGAFAQWGLEKHLFIPLSTQKYNLKTGDKVIGKIKYDTKTDRLYLDAKITRNLIPAKDFERNNKVNILIMAKTPLGYKVIVNHQYEGMIFDNEIFEKIQIGESRVAYIKTNREDGKLDCILQPIGKRQNRDNGYFKVLEKLEQSKHISLTSKSDADTVQKELGISKKAYKAIIQRLLKEDKIILNDEGITLK